MGGFVRSGFRGRKNGCGCGVDVLVRIASRMDWLLLLLLLVLYEASDLVVAATALSHAAAAGRKAICGARGSRAGIGLRDVMESKRSKCAGGSDRYALRCERASTKVVHGM